MNDFQRKGASSTIKRGEMSMKMWGPEDVREVLGQPMRSMKFASEIDLKWSIL